MRRVFASNIVSLDGFFEGPNKELDWFVVEEEFLAYSREMLRTVDTILFGRATYETMASYWPGAPADEIADGMNNLPKIVFSKTLQKAEWKNSRLSRDAATEVAKLKQLPGKDMVILGSARLTSFLLQEGLIDEYRVILMPVLLGRGNPLFPSIKKSMRLKLSRTKLLGSGVIILYYQKA